MKARLYAAQAAKIGILALLSACGVGDQADTSTEPTSHSSQALLTVRGTNTDALHSALVTISELSVIADGRSVPVGIDTARLDLAQTDERIAARFHVPTGAKTIRVMIRFDDYGGYEARNGESGVLDARGTRLSFELPAAALASEGKAQLSLDLARSLIQQRAELQTFTPHFVLSY
jgi:hypothetical protein